MKTTANNRSCIVSRQPMEKRALLRFVAGPENQIFPDLKGTLPGRGVWVECKKDVLCRAVEKNLFAKSLKAQVKVSDDLPDQVGKLLNERTLMALAMARKAGLVITGFSKVDSLLRSNKAAMLIHASDAAQDGRRKLSQAVTFVHNMGGEAVIKIDCWTSRELGKVLGTGAVMHAGVHHGGACKTLIDLLGRWFGYEGWALPKPDSHINNAFKSHYMHAES